MARPRAPGTVQARREIPEIGVTVLTLSNGVEVWLKPTDFRNDQVVFSSYARGGVSMASEADYPNASLASSFVGIGGVGGLSPVDLGKLLAGRLAAPAAYISTYTHGVTGSATPQGSRDRAAAGLPALHGAQPRSRRARSDEAAARGLAGQPGAEPRRRLRRAAAAVNTVDHYTSRPHPARGPAEARREGDVRLLRRPVQQRRQLHVLLRRQRSRWTRSRRSSPPISARCRRRARPTRSIATCACSSRPSVVRETVRKGQEPRARP